MPKFNLYQSLHTTVIGPGGKPIEVQIRSRDMHQRAEWGVASHWSYKDGIASTDIDWLNRIIDWQDEVSDPRQFLESLKTDLDQDELFVFTPKGRVVSLPVNATPVDFAYAVHTEVGHSCIGARVNGRLVPLDSILNSGDTCEVLTSTADEPGPMEEWINSVVSPKAKSKIKQWFSRERLEDLVETGRDDLVEQIRHLGMPVQQVCDVALVLLLIAVDVEDRIDDRAIRVAVPIGLSTPLLTFPSTSARVEPPTGGRSVKIAYKMPPRL